MDEDEDVDMGTLYFGVERFGKTDMDGNLS